MSDDEGVLEIINRVFAEAARAHGDNPLAIVDRVAALIAALDPAERLAVRAALQRMAAMATAGPSADTRH